MTLDQVKELFAKYDQLIYVDNLKEKSYGWSFLWDGMVLCHIVLHEGRYYDVADLSPGEIPSVPPGEFYRSFETLEDLIKFSSGTQ